MKLKKRLLSAFLSICLLTGMLPATALAEGNALVANKTTVKAGDELIVSFTQPILVEGVGALETGITFDKETFEVTKVESAKFSGASVVVTNEEEANNKGVAVISATHADMGMTVEKDMQLLALTFKVKDTATVGGKDFTLSSYLIRGGEIGMTDLTPANIGSRTITVTIESEEPAGPTDITDTMKVEFTNKKYPFGDRYGKVPETKITVGKVTLIKDTDYTVKGAGNNADDGGWPWVAGNDAQPCKVLISPVEGSIYTFKAKEYSFTPESNEDSLTIAYKEGKTLSKDEDGEPVSIETNYNQFGTAKLDPLKVMTMTSARATTGGQFLYVDGTGSSNNVVWTYYTDEACTQKTTKEGNGAAAEGGAPVKAGNYWLRAYVAPANGNIWTEATSNALPFTIRAVEEWNVTIESIKEQTYTGEELTPEVKVKNSAGQTLTKDQDYTVSYKNNVNAGTAQVTVKAIAKSTSGASKVATAEFTINPAVLTAEGLVGTLDPKTYNGKAWTPSTPSFTYQGKALTSETDYTATRISTEKPVNAGTYSYEWTVTGKGNYTGTAKVSVDFVINKVDLSGDSTYPDLYPFKNSMTYTGNPITQAKMKVYMSYYDAMVPDVDYTVYYTNNINVGTATITITPKEGGNVIFDEFTATFEIVDTYNVAPVVEKINSIESPVTLASEKAITEARTAYNALPNSAKQYVGNYTTLTDAEAKLADLKAADAVDHKIATIGTVTPASEKAIKDARAAYDALTSEQKALVKNLNTLTAAEAALADLKAADAVDQKIAAIGTVTPASEKAIKDARAAYEALTNAQKALVKNLNTLTAAEAKLADLEAADAVDQKIAAIGTVTLASEKAIKDARAAYDALTREQKVLVKNLNILTAAENTLKNLMYETEIHASEPKVTVSGSISDEKKEQAGKVELKVPDDQKQNLKDSADALREKYKVSSTIKAELAKHAISVSDTDNIEVTVKPYLSMEVKDIVIDPDNGENQVKVDIAMLCDVEVTKNSGTPVTIKAGEKIADTDCKPIEITVQLPNDIFSASEVNSKGGIYVEHRKADGSIYYHAATLTDGVGDELDKVTFTNNRGYSDFIIQLGAKPADRPVTPVPAVPGSSSGSSSSGSHSSSTQTTKSVATGDTTNLWLPIALLLLAAVGAGYCVVYLKRKKNIQ